MSIKSKVVGQFNDLMKVGAGASSSPLVPGGANPVSGNLMKVGVASNPMASTGMQALSGFLSGWGGPQKHHTGAAYGQPVDDVKYAGSYDMGLTGSGAHRMPMQMDAKPKQQLVHVGDDTKASINQNLQAWQQTGRATNPSQFAAINQNLQAWQTD